MAENTSPRPVATTRTWKLKASISGLYASTLYAFFDADSQDAIVSFLDNIKVDDLKVEYTYSGKKASSFTIDGKLILGSWPLELKFTNNDFSAKMQMDNKDPKPTKLGDVVADIFGDDLELPGFVSDIEIKPTHRNKIGLDIKSVDYATDDPSANEDGKKRKGLLFTAWVYVEGISFRAVQFRPPSDGKTKPPTQRVFALSVNVIAQAKIPLIGDLPQPFDELVFLFVKKQKQETAKAGITFGAITSINDALRENNAQELPYKITKKKYEDVDVVIAAGFHFMLLRKNPKGVANVALDYVFGKAKTKAKPKTSSSASRELDSREVAADADDQQTDQGSQKAPYEKNIGRLTIRNIGLKFEAKNPPSLSVLMDASVVLGPIGFAMLGFRLGLVFKNGLTLKQMPEPEVGLDGLAVSFDRAPVILAGMFKRVDTTYQGAATLSFEPYLFQAAGFYGEKTTGTKLWRSAFVYFILNGPLATVGFAEIRGVTGGFGYNSYLKFPTVTDVMDFPLIKTRDAKKPESALNALVTSGWFFPQEGSFWIAAGLTILAFELLDVKAVFTVEWDPKIKLGLFGLATASVPAKGPVKFANVELGLVAVIDFDAGTLKIEGQLTPASYVLDPNCHLTGGFALYTWFANSDKVAAGDFVFTIGGYHRSYKAPSQYPKPPRLGISWSYDASISIRGEAYFAITPKCCMGGGRLQATLTLGPLGAYFDAYADMLINYKPFHFTGEVGLSVGVSYTMDLWICTVYIAVEISAMLYLEGPPIAGRVHVNFWVFGFDVNFGEKKRPDALLLNLEQFFLQVLQADLPKTKSTAAIEATDPEAHVFSCNQGLMPKDDQDTESDPNRGTWRVRGAVFQFTVGCKFAIDGASIETHGLNNKPIHPPCPVPGNGTLIYAKPMRLERPLTSTVTVAIAPVLAPSPKILTGKEEPLVPKWDRAKVLTKSVPSALWGKCKFEPLIYNHLHS